MEDENKELSPFALVRNIVTIQKQMIHKWENNRQHDGLGIDYVTASVFPPLPKPIPEHETVLISRGNARNKACQTHEKYDAVWPEKHMDPTDYFIVSNIKHKKHRRNTLRELSTILKNEKETQIWVIYNNTLVHWRHISMIEVIFDPDDITIHACSSIQLDYSTDEDGKPSVSHDDGGEGVSLEEEKSRMALLLGSLNKAGLGVSPFNCVAVSHGRTQGGSNNPPPPPSPMRGHLHHWNFFFISRTSILHTCTLSTIALTQYR